MPHLILFLYAKGAETYLNDWEAMEARPMGGTEASALHMARSFQELGWQVTVTNQIEPLLRGCDVFISIRGWEIFARGIRPGKLNYLWATDDIDQPFVHELQNQAVAQHVYATVDAVMLLSRYHCDRWQHALWLPPAKTFQTTNGIPSRHFPATPDTLGARPPWAYYGSTPFRGLNLLLSRWTRILKRAPGSQLHVFSSMAIYGVPDDPAFTALYDQARGLEGVVYHGAQGQAAIRAVTRRCRVLAYPCTFPETSCITAMEAMASGCVVATTALGALPETAAGNLLVPPDSGWLDRWEDAVVEVLSRPETCESISAANAALSAKRDWTAVARSWVERFAADANRRATQGAAAPTPNDA